MRRFFNISCLAAVATGLLSVSFISPTQAQSLPSIHFAPPRNSLQPDYAGSRFRHYFSNPPPLAPLYRGSEVAREFEAATSGWSALPASVARWPAQKLPLAVYIASGEGVPGYRSWFSDIAVEALRDWSEVSGGKLKFQLVSNARDADITLSWSSSAPGNEAMLEAGNTLTTASINRRNGSLAIEHARISILTQIRGVSFTPAELKKIVLHEFGHAIGIKEHSPVPTDIMFAVTSPVQQPALSVRDINSVNQIYRGYPVANL